MSNLPFRWIYYVTYRTYLHLVQYTQVVWVHSVGVERSDKCEWFYFLSVLGEKSASVSIQSRGEAEMEEEQMTVKHNKRVNK